MRGTSEQGGLQLNSKSDQEKKIKEKSQELFSKWNELLQTGKAEKVTNKYLEEGELFGTVSNRIRHGRKEISEYFEHFLQNNPEGEIIEQKVIPINDHAFLMGGTYIFTLDDGKGEEKEVVAQFTYVWQKDSKGNWLILHHHSAKKDDDVKLTIKQELLRDVPVDNIQEGMNKSFGNSIILKTFFYKNDSNEERRVTLLLKNGKIIYEQVSLKPDDSAGV